MRGVLALTLVYLAVVALAFGPEDALRYQPPETALLKEQMDLAKTQLSFARLSLAGEVEVNYTCELSASAGLVLDLSGERRLTAEKAAIEVEKKLRRALREGVYRALKAHARLWAAEANLEAAKASLEAARLDLTAAKLRGVGPLAIAEAKNALAEAELSLETAQVELQAAEEEARALGLKGPAQPRTLSFALPQPRPDPLPALTAAIAAVRAGKAKRGLLTFAATASYQGEVAYGIKAETTGPSLSLTVGPKNPLAQSGEWRAAVTARLSLDPIAWTKAKEAELAAHEARIAAATAARERARRLETLRARAELEEKRLALAMRALDLAENRLRATRGRLARGLAAPLDVTQAQRARAQAEAQLAQVWRAYLDAVKAYLELADGEWRVR